MINTRPPHYHAPRRPIARQHTAYRSRHNLLCAAFEHFRLTWRLLCERRVSLWSKSIFVIPLIYALAPFTLDIPDFIPLIGLLDDLALLGISTLLFEAFCPSHIVHDCRMTIRHPSLFSKQITPFLECTPQAAIDLRAYRHPDEMRDLALGFAISLVILLAGGIAAGLALLAIYSLGYARTRYSYTRLLNNAIQVDRRQRPQLYHILRQTQAHLPPVKVHLFITPSPHMNAYTFGYGEPYIVILTSSLVDRLTKDELQAIIGHELGHVLLNHNRLINVLGALRGIGTLLFHKWRRTTEYSADRIAVLATGGNLTPLVTGLLKLEERATDVQTALKQADRLLPGAIELLSTHPLVGKRIRALHQFAVPPTDPK